MYLFHWPEKSFDIVNWDKQIVVLSKYSWLSRQTVYTELIYETKDKKIRGTDKKSMQKCRGVKQGCCMLLLILNTYSEKFYKRYL